MPTDDTKGKMIIRRNNTSRKTTHGAKLTAAKCELSIAAHFALCRAF